MPVNNGIHLIKVSHKPFHRSKRPSPNVSQADAKASNLYDPFRRQLILDHRRVHVTADSNDLFTGKGLQDIKFGEVSCMKDHRDISKDAVL